MEHPLHIIDSIALFSKVDVNYKCSTILSAGHLSSYPIQLTCARL